MQSSNSVLCPTYVIALPGRPSCSIGVLPVDVAVRTGNVARGGGRLSPPAAGADQILIPSTSSMPRSSTLPLVMSLSTVIRVPSLKISVVMSSLSAPWKKKPS